MITKILIFLRKHFRGVAENNAKEIAISNTIEQENSPLAIAQRKIFEEKLKRYETKTEELGKIYTERLNEHLSTYFNNFSDDQQVNEYAYDLLNKTWKAYCQKVNATQSVVKLKADRFEFETARIVRENPQFQVKLTSETIN